MRKRWLYEGIFLAGIFAVGIAGIGYLLFDPSSGCACAIDPQIDISQAEAEAYIGAAIPSQALDVDFYAYHYIRRYHDRDGMYAYIQFKLAPDQTELFLKTLPTFNALQPGFNPMLEKPYDLLYHGKDDNFGAGHHQIEGAFLDSTADGCERSIVISKDDPTMDEIFIRVFCKKRLSVGK